MKSRECPRENEIASAARRGALGDDIRGHAKGCAACSETLAVASALRELSQDDLPLRVAVDARVLWLKAQLMPRLAPSGQAERVARGTGTVWFVVGVCWTVLLAWKGPELLGILDRFSLGRMLLGSDSGTLPMASLAIVALMTTVTLAVMLHQVFVEEL